MGARYFLQDGWMQKTHRAFEQAVLAAGQPTQMRRSKSKCGLQVLLTNQGGPANNSRQWPPKLGSLLEVTQRFKNASKFMKQRVRQGRVTGTFAAHGRWDKRTLDVLGEHLSPGTHNLFVACHHRDRSSLQIFYLQVENQTPRGADIFCSQLIAPHGAYSMQWRLCS